MKTMARLSLDQIDRRLNSIRAGVDQAKVQPGWIRFMRGALGMTLRNLGEKTGLAVPTIQQAERNEASGSISLNRLKQMANAMDCDLVYAFVPRSSISDILFTAARTKARRLLKVADLHMGLEDQRVDQKMESRVEQLAKTLLEKGDIW